MGAGTDTVRFAELETVDSTNAEAHRRVAAGERGPLWIKANAQTQGRGRKGRHWTSEPGNLYATLLLSMDAPVASIAQLGFVAALAIYDMAAGFLGTDHALTLKWPNDVLLDGRKLSGILIETVSLDDGPQNAVAIGCGVNLRHAPGGTRYGATSLAEHGCEAGAPEALQQLAAAFSRWYEIWNAAEGFDAVSEVWSARSNAIGGTITVDLGNEQVTGQFAGLAGDGALVLNLGDGTRRVIRAGDVLQTSAATR